MITKSSTFDKTYIGKTINVHQKAPSQAFTGLRFFNANVIGRQMDVDDVRNPDKSGINYFTSYFYFDWS